MLPGELKRHMNEQVQYPVYRKWNENLTDRFADLISVQILNYEII